MRRTKKDPAHISWSYGLFCECLVRCVYVPALRVFLRAFVCGHCCVTRHEIHHLGSRVSVWSKLELMVDKSLLGATASLPVCLPAPHRVSDTLLAECLSG